jgi:hypothetical protein
MSVCQKTDDANQMLVCDNCNGGYHLFYLKLELTQVPADIWYCSSCSPTTPWFLLRPCHTFPGSGLGGDTWEFHLSLLLCIICVCVCVCISFWLISFYLWLVLVFLFSRVSYGFTPLRHCMSRHYMSRQLFQFFCAMLKRSGLGSKDDKAKLDLLFKNNTLIFNYNSQVDIKFYDSKNLHCIIMYSLHKL